MQNKPTDMQTMVDTLTPCEIEDIQKEAMSQLISSTGAMIKLKNAEKGINADPSPFEVLGFIAANLPAPVMSCYKSIDKK